MEWHYSAHRYLRAAYFGSTIRLGIERRTRRSGRPRNRYAHRTRTQPEETLGESRSRKHWTPSSGGRTRRKVARVATAALLESTVSAVFIPQAGILSVIGNDSDNSLTVSRDAAVALLVNNGAILIRGPKPTVANTVLVQIFGRAGNDTLRMDQANGPLPDADLFGGAWNDTIVGGAVADLLFGEAGQDTLLGQGGSDQLFGGADNDTLTGGDGDDQVFGEAGQFTASSGILATTRTSTKVDPTPTPSRSMAVMAPKRSLRRPTACACGSTVSLRLLQPGHRVRRDATRQHERGRRLVRGGW